MKPKLETSVNWTKIEKHFSYKTSTLLLKKFRVNRMQEFLAPERIAEEILGIRFKDNREYSSLPPELKSIYPSSFPAVSSAKIKDFQKAVSTGMDFVLALRKIKFAFEFRASELKQFSVNREWLENSKTYFILIVFHSYLSWEIRFHSGNCDDVSLLLDLLLSLMSVKDSPAIPQTRSLASSAFMHIYSKLIESPVISDVSQLFSPLVRFLTLNDDLPQDAFDLVLKTGNRVIDKTSPVLAKEVSSFVSFFVMIVKSCGPRYPTSITTNIIHMMREALIHLDENALNFFARSLDTIDFEDQLSVITQFPRGIASLISLSGEPLFPFDVQKFRQDNIVLPAIDDMLMKYGVVEHETFDEVVTSVDGPPVFPDAHPITEFVPSFLIDRIQRIVKIVSDKKETKEILLEKSFDFLVRCQPSEYFFDICSSLLYLIQVLLGKSELDLGNPEDLCHIPLFCQSISVFKQGPEFEKVNSIRQLAFDILPIQRSCDVIQKLFHEARIKPIIFGEMIFRFLPPNIPTYALLDLKSSLSNGIMKAMMYYQSFEDLSGDLQKAVNFARMKVLTFCEYVITSNAELCQEFMNDLSFVTPFACLIYEAPLRPFVLSRMKMYLEHNDLVPGEGFLQTIFDVMQNSFSLSHERRNVEHVADLLGFWGWMVTERPSLSSTFKKLLPLGASWVASLKGFGQAQKPTIEGILRDCIVIWSRMDVHVVSAPELSVIETLANSLYGSNSPSKLVEHLVTMIAGETITDQNKMFIFRQAKAVHLLLGLFRYSSFFVDHVNYLTRLCEYSRRNCELCQKVGFGMYLIQFLDEWRNDNLVEEAVVEGILKLFYIIASKSASVALVQRFISLLCPVDGHLSRFHSNILNTLKAFVDGAKVVVGTPIPLVKSMKMRISGFVPDDMPCFSIVFWVSLNIAYSNHRVYVCEIEDQSGNVLSIWIKNETMHLAVRRETDEWIAEMKPFTFPLDKWCFITATVKPSNNRAVVYLSANGLKMEEVFFPVLEFSGPVEVLVGHNETEENCVLLGGFGIYPGLDASDTMQYYELGPRRMPWPPDPAVYFSGGDYSGFVTLDYTTKSDTVKVTMKQNKRIVRPPSFTDILIDRCGVSILLPILVQVDIKTVYEERCAGIFPTFLDIIENALKYSSAAERAFENDHGFSIIAQLLRDMEMVELDFKTFMRFCTLYDELVEVECKTELLFKVLLNVEIWLKADAKSHEQIVHYLSRSLIPANLSLISQRLTLKHIFAILRTYYWYEPLEEATIKCLERCRKEKLDVKQCRHGWLLIGHLLLKITGGDAEVFELVMTQILTVKDFAQIFDLVEFLKELVEVYPIVIRENHETLLQFFFLSSTSEEFVEDQFKCLLEWHKTGVFGKLSLSEHVSLILHQITFDMLPPFEPIWNLCKEGAYAFLPLSAMLAYFYGDKTLRAFIADLKPTIKYCCNQFWPVWLVIIYYAGDESIRSSMMDFLIGVSSQEWKNVLDCFDIIGRITTARHENTKCRMLTTIAHKLLKESVYQGTRHFFRLIKSFLFFRSKNRENKQLSVVAFEQPVQDEKPLPLRSTKRRPPKIVPINKSSGNSLTSAVDLSSKRHENRLPSPIPTGRRTSGNFDMTPLAWSQTRFEGVGKMTLATLMNKITALNRYDVEQVFGISWTNNGKWESLDLAKLALDVFLKEPDVDYCETVMMILAFLTCFEPEKTYSHVLKEIERVAGFENVRAVSFYNYHARKYGIQPLTEEDEASTVVKANEFLREFAETKSTSSYLDELIDALGHHSVQSQSYRNAVSFYGQISADLIASYKDEVAAETSSAKRLWKQFWRSVTIDRAPWNPSHLESEDGTVHFKRDFTLCTAFCPFKLRQNFGFDDHMKASLARDTGDFKIASELVEERRLKELAEKRAKSGTAKILDDLDETEDTTSDAGEILVTTNCIVELPCEIITVNHTQNAFFSLQKNVLILTKDDTSKTIPIRDIRYVFKRTQLHKETAIEIFDVHGMSYFINFPSTYSDTVLQLFKSTKRPKTVTIQTQPFKTFWQQSKITQQWVNREISNFEYLIMLNMYSGRSFNNVSQYPMMPWILTDYSSDVLDLRNPNFYRDLSKPIGAMDPERLSTLLEQYEAIGSMGIPPYLYTNGCVSPLSLYLWLIRMEPFTTLHIEMQEQRFDQPTRLFLSIGGAFKCATTQQNDYRELIPEFFFCPEFLKNKNKFDLGSIDGVKVDDVILPPWAKTPMDFIYLHRKALESEFVSNSLNKWIDLVWGEKQRGQKAVEAHNVYKWEMYPDVWKKFTPDGPASIAEIETTLGFVGQIPQQLFDHPHPVRIGPSPEHCSLDSKKTIHLKTGKIIAAKILSTSSRQLTILTIGSSGACVTNTIDVAALLMRRGRTRRSLSDLMFGDFKAGLTTDDMNFSNATVKSLPNFRRVFRKDAKIPVFSYIGNKMFCLVGVQKGEVYAINAQNGSCKKVINHRTDVVALASDEEWFAVADKDAVVSVYFTKDLETKQFSIPAFTDEIRCCNFSRQFHTLVCGTRDNRLMICSVTSRSIVRVIKLHNLRPMSILITPSWGFIVVCLQAIEHGQTKHYLSVYNINGTAIRKRQPIPNGVSCWTAWSSVSGFDFILMADEKDMVYAFEAYYAQIGEKRYISPSPVSSLHYIEKHHVAVILTNDGGVTFVPCVCSEFASLRSPRKPPIPCT